MSCLCRLRLRGLGGGDYGHLQHFDIPYPRCGIITSEVNVSAISISRLQSVFGHLAPDFIPQYDVACTW
jgi:hypothetical protein